eukprot:scaffold231797_cov28-Prasinocladus_malaysianus.AAC.2
MEGQACIRFRPVAMGKATPAKNFDEHGRVSDQPASEHCCLSLITMPTRKTANESSRMSIDILNAPNFPGMQALNMVHSPHGAA